MPRRNRNASARPAAGPNPATELRGRNAAGQVRPADDRYLSAEEIAERDAYVAKVTGHNAQQLVVKREAPDHVKALAGRDRGEDQAEQPEEVEE